jgi:hypothetical protein
LYMPKFTPCRSDPLLDDHGGAGTGGAVEHGRAVGEVGSERDHQPTPPVRPRAGRSARLRSPDRLIVDGTN